MTDQSHTQLPINKDALRRRIERLDVAADIKLLLNHLLETTIAVGDKIVQIGSKIIDFVLDFAKSYPGVTLGVVVALVLAFLVNSIPVLGPVLAPILTPLLLIIGVGLGALNDLTDSSMKLKMSAFVSDIRSL